MKIKYIFLLTAILLGCQDHSPRSLQQQLEKFESELLLVFPDYAAAMGIPQATDVLVIPSKEKIKENLNFCQKYLERFESFQSFENQPELNEKRIEKIEILKGMIGQLTGPRSPFNDPGFYYVYPALAWRISQLNQEPSPSNIKLLLKTLTKIPTYFSHAKTNLDDPNINRTNAALDLQEKTFDFLSTTVAEKIGSLPKNDVRNNLKMMHENAEIAVKDYTAFCKSILIELKKLEQASDN